MVAFNTNAKSKLEMASYHTIPVTHKHTHTLCVHCVCVCVTVCVCHISRHTNILATGCHSPLNRMLVPINSESENHTQVRSGKILAAVLTVYYVTNFRGWSYLSVVALCVLLHLVVQVYKNVQTAKPTALYVDQVLE